MGLFSSKDKTDSKAVSNQITLTDGSVVAIAQTVDCLGDSCPRPQLMTKKAVGSIGGGEVVEVLVDNPTSMEALPPMCPQLGATHLETKDDKSGWRVYIRKD